MSVPASVQASPQDRDRIARLVCGHMATRVIGTAATLGLADLIGDEPVPATELAGTVGCHPGALLRLLRAMAALELLVETEAGVFRLTGAGVLLRTDRPDSMRSFVGMTTHPAMLDAWRLLDGAVRAGSTVFDQVFGTDFFRHLGSDPELSEQFNTAMRQSARIAAQVLPSAFDFGRYGTLADIGGGNGTVLSAILAEHPRLRGILFDTPDGIAEAEVPERCERQAGDFFTAVPAGADLYLLKSIVHDWDDARCASILGNIRGVIPEHGRLLVVEPVLPEVVQPGQSSLAYLSDLNMLVNLGGQERTGADFARLFAASGFELADVTPLPPARFSLIEAVPA
ncbi:methyltransferase [Amycolatopsis cihanbeyliensis]|uniref:Methyltransferase family protein n=1 Tax=Amycolatopsis cihanbeyliensis TaxID=1128664 RepID=A0A542DQ01_AMYCI|nr:methyltransferase [Amycolatopsis cihanbeyliensis]TQJ05136.1 methyltransferase family protein [Amycolatopsis cihanbeyliensis]